ncbi:hypothetical protein MJO29_011018 [Puccinia striiformis f. sp. tritici]|uniref:hypothetical protein n=1 Tax=Puccinia striiformis f. sp. tritici TaxID=168172 RepID=UPI0020076363|nr:hypothetical protein Pst134EA_020932 [Puccinia striiformis f. sp. tritici]KAH9457032.1 hypothetical protein Pst134EA_020932 [Puccinia striiformis f. sp. tritici]KAI7946491.1 hypothetical protein MJO29_011018 [Puccinia striiformis f. sp. tritici]
MITEFSKLIRFKKSNLDLLSSNNNIHNLPPRTAIDVVYDVTPVTNPPLTNSLSRPSRVQQRNRTIQRSTPDSSIPNNHNRN